MKKYIVTRHTLAIIPIEENKTEVIEDYNIKIIHDSSLNIIDESCKFYGSSLKGRAEGTNYLIGIRYKCPILVSEKDLLIFFPTTSAKKSDCSWINYNEIMAYQSINDDCVQIFFKNGKKLDLVVTNYIFTTQLLKSSRLDSVLKSKK